MKIKKTTSSVYRAETKNYRLELDENAGKDTPARIYIGAEIGHVFIPCNDAREVLEAALALLDEYEGAKGDEVAG